jgi:hypothetical protein
VGPLSMLREPYLDDGRRAMTHRTSTPTARGGAGEPGTGVRTEVPSRDVLIIPGRCEPVGARVGTTIPRTWHVPDGIVHGIVTRVNRETQSASDPMF